MTINDIQKEYGNLLKSYTKLNNLERQLEQVEVIDNLQAVTYRHDKVNTNSNSFYSGVEDSVIDSDDKRQVIEFNIKLIRLKLKILIGSFNALGKTEKNIILHKVILGMQYKEFIDKLDITESWAKKLKKQSLEDLKIMIDRNSFFVPLTIQGARIGNMELHF